MNGGLIAKRPIPKCAITLSEITAPPSPHIAPRAAMIAEDFARVRVLATESIATPMIEGARTRTRAKDR